VNPAFALLTPFLKEVDKDFEVIVHEAQLCLQMLGQMKIERGSFG